MSFTSTNWPPLSYSPVSSSWRLGSTLAQPTAPPTQLPAPTSRTQTWTASAAPVNNTQPVNYAVTAQQTYNIFRIINQTPGTATPGSNNL